jgi:acyl-CoA dehydrogenase
LLSLHDDDIRGDDLVAAQEGVYALCRSFGTDYWKEKDAAKEYPEEFIAALQEGGWLSILIPAEFGGGGMGIKAGAAVLEAITRSGAAAAPAHAQMYTMGTVLRHGSDELKARFLPEIAAGRLRLQAFGVTEAESGSDTTRIRTRAVRDGAEYVINGSKMFISRFAHSDLMLLLARTTPYEEVAKKTDGISVFLVDLAAAGGSIKSQPIKTMVNHETFALFFDDLRVPAANLIGEEGKGFRYILSGLNAERILVSSESIGGGLWFIDRATEYASNRVVFGRPIGTNQGVQFPLAKAYADVMAASYVRWRAVDLFESGRECGSEATTAKMLSSLAQWAAANAAMDTFGGYGMTEEYGIERRFREARLSLVAPVNNNLALSHLATQVLGLPKSY